MTRIDFYILPDSDLEARWRFAARLTQRAYGQGHHLLLHTGSRAQATAIDQLLWQYPQHAFLPHGVAGTAAARGAGIVIGFEDESEAEDVLINLADEMPPFFARFERVAEIVVQHPQVRDPSRERFKHYRERGYPLFHHDMKDWED